MFLFEGVLSLKTFEFFPFDQTSLEKHISIKPSLAPILFNYL